MADEPIKEENQEKTPRSQPKKVGRIFFILIFVILIGGLGLACFQLSKINLSLTHIVQNLQQKMTNNQNEMATLQNSMNDLQETVKKSAMLSQQQEQMINAWQAAQKGNLNKWYVAEAQYLTKLANDNAQFAQNISLAIILLQRAQQTLQNLQDPNLLEIQKSLTNDITHLQSTQPVDVTQLYLKLTALINQVNQLPIPINPTKLAEKNTKPEDLSNLPWWKAGLHFTMENLRKVVIVRNIGNQTPPLVLPEEKHFLYQNLHAQLEDVIWSVLHKDQDIYQASLTRAIAWTHQFFDQESSVTKNFLQELQTLQTIHVQSPPVNFSDTLQLFEHYLSQPEVAKTE